jgi:glycosyltransferase involved in cell wall biosynthesis
MTDDRPIAIAYDCLYPFTTGGGERQYRAFAEAMVERGAAVEYLTARQWDEPVSPAAPFEVVPVSGPLELYSADGVRRSAAAAAFAGGLFRGLLRRRRRYRAVLVSGLPVLNVFAARAALLGSGTVVAVDYLEVWGRRQWREYAGALMGTTAWLLQRAAIRLTPLATCHSQLTAGRLRSEGFKGRILVSPGLIDGSVSPPAASAGAAQPPYVLYVGRHIPDKRVESLPAAVARARREVPGLRLCILGAGPSTPAIREAIDRVGGNDWVELPGFVPQERLDELLSSAVCLVNPSRREGYGLVVVEAASHGTPVVLVADEGNAATELVEEDRNGFVAASVGETDLAGAIVRAVSGGDSLRARTRTWYERALQEKTVGRTVDAILAALSASKTIPGRRASADPQEGHQ